MANENSFWMDTMLPSVVTGAISTASNLGIMALQNKFNAEQAQIARNWNLDVDNSKYQRAVVDMQKAGVNPALMMSKGPISTQAATNIAAQGATPAYMNMSAIASLAQSISQAKLNDAQRRNIDANTDKTKAEADYYKANVGKITQETIGISIDNQYRDEFNQLRNEGQRLANDVSAETIKEIKQHVEVMKADVAKKLAEAKTEEERVRLMVTQEMLNQAEVYKIYALTPFYQNLAAAQTEDAKASAGLKLVQAAYEQGLIDEGMIEAAVKKTYAEANDADARAIINETKHALGFEKAEVKNIKSDTFKNYTHAATEIVNTLANVVNTVVGAATGTPGSIPSSAFVMQ